MPLCDGAAAYGDNNVQVLNSMFTEAKSVTIATPIYNFDANAALKNLVEFTGRSWSDKPIGFICAAGGQGSYMSIMSLANSLMLDFRCIIVPRFVYATGDDFSEDNIPSDKIKQRLAELAEITLKLSRIVEN